MKTIYFTDAGTTENRFTVALDEEGRLTRRIDEKKLYRAECVNETLQTEWILDMTPGSAFAVDPCI